MEENTAPSRRRPQKSESGFGLWADPGLPRYERVALALLLVLLSICAVLQSVIITLRVAGSPPTSDPCPVEPTEGGRQTGRQEEETSISMTSHGSWGTYEDPSHLCPPNWVYIYQKCYYFSSRKMSQAESDQICTTYDSKLASVPKTLISLRRIITRLGQEFWVRIQKPDSSWSPETQKRKWPDGSMEDIIVGGAGSCVKLGQHLKMENCYSELPWICERDMAERRD
ncbi:killer cell lectin-like receptor subfamily B member 1A [Lithobates pipiens]